MKTTNLLTIALTASTFAACAQATEPDDAGLPPDPEHGLETMDGKADSFAIRPGSPEADAILAYVNREITNDAEGTQFRDDLDARLHAWAARNIAEYRAGNDGTFGTADDRQFESIGDVDGVSWVGRSAMMRLFELAEAAGLFQRPTVDCAEYIPHNRWNHYRIDSYADLLEFENSRCSVINGDLRVQITGTDLLPPQAREIRHLRYLETIKGDLHIVTSDHWNSVHFEGLETVTGNLRAESPSGRSHTVDFPSLTSASSIYLSQIESSLFGALEHNEDIELHNNDLEGFTALKSAVEIDVHQRPEGTYNVSFPELTEVVSLEFDVYRRNRWTTPDVSFTGGFPKLENAGALSLSSGKYGELKFDELVEVGRLNTSQTTDPYVGMSELATVNGLTADGDVTMAGVHSGPESLETVGRLKVTTQEAVDGYDVLTTAESSIWIKTDRGIQGFDALDLAGGAIQLYIGQGRSQATFNGFNALTYAESIRISGYNADVVIGPLFESLEFTGGRLSIESNGGFTENPVFTNLAGIGGDLRVDALRDGLDMMPELQVVDGSVTINRTPAELTGFPKLEVIEGGLTLKRSVDTITGWQKLTALGGNLSVPRTLEQPELDNFLLQLEEFSGTINYN